jgi:tripartite ATP-independent transporter DctP family solute receptor
MGHDVAPTHPWHQGALRLAELVNKKTNGEVNIEVFPSSQLGDLRELMELTQTGSIDFNMNTSGVAASFIPDMNLLNLPFLFNDRSQLKSFYESPLARRILDSGEKNRIKGFAFHTYVFRGPMNSKRPIKTIEDFKGLKIRLMQVPIHMDTYKALGASPVAIPFSELYTAAQMGTVDGFENSAVTLYYQKLYEVGKYYSTIPVFAYTNVILGSMKTWNEKLNESQRKAFLESLPEAVTMINKGSDEGEEIGLKKFSEAGVQVYTGPFDLKSFREAMKPVYDKWSSGISKEAQEILKELQKQWK